jgi:tetratricopeptide (TPR) repeat protein
VRRRQLVIIAAAALFLFPVHASLSLTEYVSHFPAYIEGISLTISWPTYLAENIDTIIKSVIVAIIIVILFGVPNKALNLLKLIYYRNRRFKSYYDVVWKKSSTLRPEEVLGLRGKPEHGFLEYYYERENDKIIRDKIVSNKNVLVLGSPLAGKSRAIYQALRSLEKPRDVLIPRLVDINPESFQIPFHSKFWRKRVVFIDDIDKFADMQNFYYLIREILKKKDIAIVASCRSGPEYAKLSQKMESQLSFIFEYPVEIAKISEEEADYIQKTIGAEMPSEFDGNIGSIFIKLDTMRERFRGCGGIEKGILRSIKRLYYAGIYDEREIFSIERIKRVCEMVEEIDLKNYEWKTAIDNLKFTKNLFSGDPEALFNIGSRACNLGLVYIEKRTYLWIAIEAYEEAINHLNRVPIQYAAAQNNLGNAYCILADVEDKTENCKRAIEAFQEALKVRTLDKFPIDYSATQNNMGNAYSTLAEVEDMAENCKMAIEAYQEALKVRTLEQFPIDYAATQNNMGNAYCQLADVEDKYEITIKAIEKAIEACQEALKVRTLDKFPIDYSATQNNMGNAYRRLAEVSKKTDSKAENCKRAIKAHLEALKVRTRDRFPMDYAMTQNNLGVAYQTLARVESQAENCKMAIKACQDALEVYTIDRFPMDYAMTQNSLGNAYKTLAEVEDQGENCKRAIKAYQDALKIYTNEAFPERNRGVARNLKNILEFCKETSITPTSAS